MTGGKCPIIRVTGYQMLLNEANSQTNPPPPPKEGDRTKPNFEQETEKKLCLGG